MAEPKVRFMKDDGSSYPDWKTRDIKSFAQCIAGATPSTKVDAYWKNGTIPWMSSGEVHKGLVFETDARITQEGYDNTSTKMVPPNTVVMALAGQGKTRGTVALTKISLCTNQSLCSIVTDESVLPEYLYQYLITQYQSLRQASSGDGTRGGLNLQIVGDYCVAIPSDKEEQQRIANFLSSVDDVIVASEQEVANLETQKKAVMKKIFTQEVRFKKDDGTDFPEWEEKRLDEVVEFLDGMRKPIETGDRVAGPYPYYGASGITDYVEGYIFDEDLILLSEDGANILDRNYRVCFMARGKYWVNNHAHVLRANTDCVNEYICEYLESLDYSRMNSGSAQPKLNQQTCRKIPVKKPCLEEQRLIADFFSNFDEAITAAKQELELWKELKKGLLQQMFV